MRLLLLTLLSLAGCGGCVTQSQYERSQSAAVRLEWDNGALCSGVATGPHSIITAAHCTEAGGASGTLKINDKPSRFVVVADDGSDHVLLRVEQRQDHTARLASRHRFRVGELLYLWGNPERMAGVLRVGRIAGTDKDSTLCMGTMKPLRVKCTVIYFDGALTHGDSGGAYFDSYGRVVGIESGGAVVGAWSMPFFYPLTFTQAQLEAATA